MSAEYQLSWNTHLLEFEVAVVEGQNFTTQKTE